MPKKLPVGFKRDVVAVAGRGDLTIAEVAADFDVPVGPVRRWVRQVDVDDGVRDGLTSAEQSEVVQLRRVKRRREGSVFAVGSSSGKTAADVKTLVERWNGARWSVISSPNPPGPSGPYLSDVTCPSAKRCFAVGSYRSSVGTTTTSSTGFTPDDGTSNRTLIERWDGTRSSIVTSPNLPGFSGLVDLACASPTSCFAVGTSGFHTSSGDQRTPLVEHWDGTIWTIT
jgi:transposase